MITVPELYNYFLQNPKVCTDSRTILQGSIFFALKGPSFNGNTFADLAIEKGASFVVIDESKYRKDDRYLLVENALKALQDLAGMHRRHLQIPVLAITGSNGKTTSKELIRSVLAKKFNVLATKGNLNNHIGVPLTLLEIKPDIEIAIIEMGANHQGEIESYCKIADPDYGLITNVGKAHLEGFGGFEGVKKGKRELYHWIDEHGKIIFMNGDNKDLGEMAASLDPRKFVLYGTNSAFDVYAVLQKTQPALELSWKSAQQQGHCVSQLIGEYNFENILAAIAVGNYFGVEAHLIDAAINAYVPDNSRSQLVERNSNKIILDAYNANPSSMEAALRNFSLLPDNKKVICIGDMAELGDDTDKEHLRILKLLEDIPHEELILVGDNFGKYKAGIKCQPFSTAEQAAAWIKLHPFKDKTILIKGSRSIKMETILDAI
ncbi:MAG TPA: UDP-N-acetylmuramoyl-tripeptide--D-alanyl-D-alanine ligase [Bacteroidia bacterium]|nr:UDP-N-acetylmuramoyl-tripeptide--D-alanyl-D-alanine ligase [Bacteroidia bacterium]HNS12832.1 UDP-N-acetylmuramoyl-tripeptide--D-alanyl-D-alanine ligase [Bacteroidia bacterium]